MPGKGVRPCVRRASCPRRPLASLTECGILGPRSGLPARRRGLRCGGATCPAPTRPWSRREGAADPRRTSGACSEALWLTPPARAWPRARLALPHPAPCPMTRAGGSIALPNRFPVSRSRAAFAHKPAALAPSEDGDRMTLGAEIRRAKNPEVTWKWLGRTTRNEAEGDGGLMRGGARPPGGPFTPIGLGWARPWRRP